MKCSLCFVRKISRGALSLDKKFLTLDQEISALFVKEKNIIFPVCFICYLGHKTGKKRIDLEPIK